MTFVLWWADCAQNLQSSEQRPERAFRMLQSCKSVPVWAALVLSAKVISWFRGIVVYSNAFFLVWVVIVGAL